MKITTDKQKGVSLIITFFIMIIILAIVLSISIILYSEVGVVNDTGNSVASLYAGESGIEKVLYYERQVPPHNNQICADSSTCTSTPYTFCSNGFCAIPLARGLCSIFSSCTTQTSSGDPSIYCNAAPSGPNPPVVTPLASGGCNPAACTNCSISFATVFDGRTYYTTAQISPDNDGVSHDLKIESKGTFGASARQIETLTVEPQ
jgi:hypothetical protein